MRTSRLRWRGLAVGLAGVTAALGMAVPPAQAAGTLDQFQTDGSTNSLTVSDTGSSAQTFTAGKSGDLAQVDVLLTTNGPVPLSGPVTIEIHAVEGGVPGADVLASGTVGPAGVTLAPTWFSVDLATPATVQNGNEYAIVASYAGGVPALWLGRAGDLYPAGYAIAQRNGSWSPVAMDLAFRTYVTVTTPQKQPASLTLGNLEKQYDSEPSPVSVTTSPDGLTGVTVTYDGSTTPPTYAGSYEVVATLDNPDYEAASVTDTLFVAPRVIDAGFAVADKVYDGTTTATITRRTAMGAVPGDDVQLVGGTADFLSSEVGTWQVTGSGFELWGTDVGNYVLSPLSAMTQATITAPIPTPSYRLSGFYKPIVVSTGPTKVWNTVKGGRTVSLKFEVFDAVTDTEMTDTAVVASFATRTVACGTGTAGETPVEVVGTGATSLKYDANGGQFVQKWKTPTVVGTCYQVSVKTTDGSVIDQAFFEIKK